MQGSDGNIYGTAKLGPTGGGTLYRMDLRGVTSTLRYFNCPTDGCAPNGGLVRTDDGAIYGTNLFGGGGNPGGGTIFRVRPNGILDVLHVFDCAAAGGCQPMAGLLQASDGAFYGVTSRGGPDDGGAVIEMTADGTVTTLHALDCRADGCRPQGRLIEGSDGYLYGTTSTGGPLGGGVVFRVNPHPGAPAAVSSPPCIEAPVSASAGTPPKKPPVAMQEQGPATSFR